jgi:hypothetical protein
VAMGVLLQGARPSLMDEPRVERGREVNKY